VRPSGTTTDWGSAADDASRGGEQGSDGKRANRKEEEWAITKGSSKGLARTLATRD
jgi:hypothetical protein